MNLGWPEILLIVFVVLILFGAKRIPEMMKSMGQGVKEFKKAARELSDVPRTGGTAIEAGDSYRVIPWQMGVVAKLLRLLPYRWYFPIVHRLTGL